jgi:hypothetical protein
VTARNGPHRGETAVLATLAAGGTYAQAAAAAGVGERTVKRWVAERPDFRQELAQLRRLALEEAATVLTLAAGEAARRLCALATEAASASVLPAHTRLRACVEVLAAATRAHELLDLEARISALEAKGTPRP